MNKDRVIKMLEEAIMTEEGLIPIYARHFSSSLVLSGLKKETTFRIREILNQLQRETEGHKGALMNLLDEIRGSEKNVY